MRLVGNNSLVESVSSGWCDEVKLLVFAWCVVKLNFSRLVIARGRHGQTILIWYALITRTNLGNTHETKRQLNLWWTDGVSGRLAPAALIDRLFIQSSLHFSSWQDIPITHIDHYIITGLPSVWLTCLTKFGELRLREKDIQ